MANSDRELERLSFSVQYLEICESLLHSRGLDTARLYQVCGLEPGRALLPGQTINGLQLRRMFELALDVVRQDDAPPIVAVMAHFPLTIHGPLGMLALSSATLGEALQGALDYAQLVMPAFRIRQERYGQSVHVIFDRLYDFGAINDVFTESVVATFTKIDAFLARLPESLVLHFTHSPIGDAVLYEKGLGGKVLFNQPMTRLILTKSDLNIPLLTPSRSSRMLMQATLERQRLLNKESRPITEQVKRFLQQAQEKGQALDASGLASQLNVSPRTLSRRLQDEGTSVRQLQTEVSLEQAELLLIDTNLTIAEIARKAGFNEPASFSRAFRRFNGLSPREYRSRAGKGAGENPE